MNYGRKPAESLRSAEWPKVRREHLKTDKSCNICGGTKKLQVHHVKPFHLFPDLELSQDNLITLCETPGHNCHLWFGHLLNWQAYNPAVREDAGRMADKIEHRPKQ